MKKGYLTAAAAAALSAAMAFGAWAASFQTVNQVMYVNASSLNVRTEPSTTAGKAQSLSRGTAVQVNGLSGDWARILLGGKNYYVASRYLSIGNSAAAGTTTAASTPVSVPEGVTVSDIAVSDNLRFAVPVLIFEDEAKRRLSLTAMSLTVTPSGTETGVLAAVVVPARALLPYAQ